MDAKTGNVVDEFHRYVRPTETPQLSLFCKRLTGISQETVTASDDLPTVLRDLENWLRLKKKELGCVFKLDSPNAAVFATWTDWDIRTCLWNECQRKHLPLPVDLLTRIDLKAVFKVSPFIKDYHPPLAMVCQYSCRNEGRISGSASRCPQGCWPQF